MSNQESPPEKEPDPQELARSILQQTSGIIDRRQRSFAIGVKLAKLSAETVLEIFRIIARKARMKEPLYQDGFRTVSDIKRMARHIGFDKMAQVYTLARRKDYVEVLSFMQSMPPARKLGVDEELEEDPMLKEMTLGVKRQKARMRDRDLINRLCHEQDPLTIEHLLRNPVVTIQHVVRIASKRPTSSEVLRVVYKDLKWVNHYVVKKALINNPYTPTEISLALLSFLLEQDLEDVAENMLLHKELKRTAVELIKIKRGLAEAEPEKDRDREPDEREDEREDEPAEPGPDEQDD